MRRIELRDTDRKLVEHRTLRFAEGTEFACLLFHFLDIDRVARNPFAHQRKIGDPDSTPCAVDRGAEDALDRLAAIGCLLRDFGSGPAIHRFDQFDLVGNNLVRALRTHGSDIGLVDQTELHVRAAEPHRHRRCFDQAYQGTEILARTRGFFAKMRKFCLAVAEVEDPDQGRTAGRDRRVGQRTLHRQRLSRAGRNGQRHPERLGGLLRSPDVLGQLVHLIFAQSAPIATRELAKIFGHAIESDPASQPLGRLDPSVCPDQQRDGRALFDQARQPLCGVACGHRFLLARAGAQHDPHRARGPQCQQEAEDGQQCG